MLGFIHIPKNGGSSVKKWFQDNQVDVVSTGHARFSEVDYTTADWWFATCRNPYHRVISYYEFSKNKADQFLAKHPLPKPVDDPLEAKELLHQSTQALYNTGFENWVLHYSKLVPQFEYTQVSYITNASAKINYVLKLENVKREWLTLQIITGVCTSLKTVNPTQKTLQQYYTKTSQEFVCELFREDFEFFKYSKDLPKNVF